MNDEFDNSPAPAQRVAEDKASVRALEEALKELDWEAAARNKAKLPHAVDGPFLLDDAERDALADQPLLYVPDAEDHPVRFAPEPAEHPSQPTGFGHLGDCVRLVAVRSSKESAEAFAPGRLLIRLREGELDPVLPASVRLFRRDEEHHTWILQERSGLVEPHIIGAEVTRDGLYCLVGLPAEPALRSTLRATAELTSRLGSMEDDAAEELVGRLWHGVRCGADGADSCAGCREILRWELPELQLFHAHGHHTDPSWVRPWSKKLIPRFERPYEPREFLPLWPRPSGGWVEGGPADLSGAIYSLSLDPKNPDRLWAAAANGGIWRLDGAQTQARPPWFAKSDQVFTLAGVAVAASPVRADRVWAVLGRSVFRSDDAGTNWTRNSTRDLGKIRNLAPHPTDADRLLVASTTGVFVSTNAAITWTRVRAGDHYRALWDADGRRIYAAEHKKGVLTHAGPNHSDASGWSMLLPWTAAEYGKTGKYGESRAIRLGVGALGTSANRTIAIRFGEGVYLRHRTESSFRYLGKVGGDGQGNWSHCIAIDPHDDRVILAAGQDLHRYDSGWTKVGGYHSKGTHADFQDLVFSPSRKGLVFAATDGGVHRSTDGGKTWRYLVEGLQTAQLYRGGVSGDQALATQYHWGLTHTSSLRTRLWTSQTGGGWEFHHAFGDPKRDGTFYIFAGTLWRADKAPPTKGWLKRIGHFKPDKYAGFGGIAVDLRKGSEILLIARQGTSGDPKHGIQISRDVDTQATWSKSLETDATDGGHISSIEFCPSDPKRVVAATRDRRIFVCPDIDRPKWTEAGRFDVASTSKSRLRQIAVCATDADRLYGIDGTRVRGVGRSTDGGATWTDVSSGLGPEKPVCLIAHPSDGKRLFLSTPTAVYQGTDVGSYIRWELIDLDLPNVSTRLLTIRGRSLWAITFGRGVWRLPI